MPYRVWGATAGRAAGAAPGLATFSPLNAAYYAFASRF